jgi:hypothetical protein
MVTQDIAINGINLAADTLPIIVTNGAEYRVFYIPFFDTVNVPIDTRTNHEASANQNPDVLSGTDALNRILQAYDKNPTQTRISFLEYTPGIDRPLAPESKNYQQFSYDNLVRPHLDQLREWIIGETDQLGDTPSILTFAENVEINQ